jgi:TonB family protein
VTLRLRLDADGALRDAAVARSSGREVLDRQALAMVQGVDAWPQPPEALRSGEAFSVLMPVVFRLED